MPQTLRGSSPQCCKAGAARTCSRVTKPNGCRSQSAIPVQHASSPKSIGDIRVPPELAGDSAAGAAARGRDRRLPFTTFGEEFASIGVQLGARYDGSPIIAGDEAPPPDDFARLRANGGVPGGPAPHAWLGAGRGIGDSPFDRFGTGFTLLRLGTGMPDAERRLARLRGSLEHPAQAPRCRGRRHPRTLWTRSGVWYGRISMSHGAAMRCRQTRAVCCAG